MTNFQMGLFSCLLAGLSTSMGALALFLRPSLTPRLTSGLLGFGGGVMLAASSFSLLIPAFQDVRARGSFALGLSIVLLGMAMGALILFALDRLLPHEHVLKGKEGPIRGSVSRAWLFVLAIAIHNFPEGLAVGVGYGLEDARTGKIITTGIILQNLPEGLIVAVALVSVGYTRLRAFFVAMMTGLVEVAGGLLGLYAVVLGRSIVPVGLGFAAGAMIYVVCHEVIPESFRRGYERTATAGLMTGYMLMVALDQSL